MNALLFIAASLLTAAIASCGGGESTPSGRTEEEGVRDAAAPGSGDASPAQPTASWPDSALAPPPTSLECLSGPCKGAGGLEPCCTADGACGARYLGRAGAGCVALDGEGRIDPDCPSSGETAGCCRPNGYCGAFYTATFGCVDPQAFPDPPAEEIPCVYDR